MKKGIIILSLLISAIWIFQSCTKENDLLGDGDIREEYVGNWTANDQCAKQTYGVNIGLDGSNSTQVIISNFANLGYSAEAIVAGNSIYVENQEIGGGYSVSGNGKLTGSIITWTSYNFETEGDVTNCICTYTEQ